MPPLTMTFSETASEHINLHTASMRDRPAQSAYGHADVPAQRRRVRAPRATRHTWQCENCAEPNGGARRRCWDCGTSRF